MSRRRNRREAIVVINSLKRKYVGDRDNVVADSSLSVESTENSFQHEASQLNFEENVNINKFGDINVNKVNINSRNTSVRENLARWSVEHNITTSALNDLLKILRLQIHDLPSDARTLKRTPKEVVTRKLGEGEYMHYGLRDCLTDFLEKNLFEKKLFLLISI